jgi:hypothetical protein
MTEAHPQSRRYVSSNEMELAQPTLEQTVGARVAAVENSVRLRSIRRAIAINAVETARDHRGERDEPVTQADADTIVAIMELLDRVAGG